MIGRTKLDPDPFTKMLQAAVKHEVKCVLEEEIANAQVAVERRVRNVADKIALNILSQYRVETMQNEIVITVKKDALK